MDLKPWLVYGGIGVVGLALTYVLASPGPYEVSVGALRFDPYYVAMTGFASLVVLAVVNAVGLTIPEKYYPPGMRD